MADRLLYEDTEKRIFVTAEATDSTPQVERVEWANENVQRLRDRLSNGLSSNRDFLAVASPNAAAVAAQTRAPTRQMQAVIRLVSGLLDGDD